MDHQNTTSETDSTSKPGARRRKLAAAALLMMMGAAIIDPRILDDITITMSPAQNSSDEEIDEFEQIELMLAQAGDQHRVQKAPHSSDDSDGKTAALNNQDDQNSQVTQATSETMPPPLVIPQLETLEPIDIEPADETTKKSSAIRIVSFPVQPQPGPSEPGSPQSNPAAFGIRLTGTIDPLP